MIIANYSIVLYNVIHSNNENIMECITWKLDPTPSGIRISGLTYLPMEEGMDLPHHTSVTGVNPLKMLYNAVLHYII